MTRRRAEWLLAGILLALLCAHVLVYRPSEPFFNNDETRHVMTGVFFKDSLVDRAWQDPYGYTVRYYLQYPALGLVVWPPLFYAVEGAVMLVFGTSFVAGRVLVGGFALLACGYLFALARRTHSTRVAAIAVLLFGLAPLVFMLSSRVMLEVPALAFVLASVFYFVRYLDEGRRRDLWFAALASAAGVLTRFDAACIVAVFVVLLACRREWRVLVRLEVWLAAALALALVAPVAWITIREFGWVHERSITNSLVGTAASTLGQLFFYPASVPGQVGWATTSMALVGLARLRQGWRRLGAPYLALLAGVYATLTPVSELDSRHTIYWVPAIALSAATAADWLGGRSTLRRWAFTAVLVGGTTSAAFRLPDESITGYSDAAAHVVSATAGPGFCLFDGCLNGDFIYQIRVHDPARRLWVLRGDKLFYSTIVDAATDYTPFVKTRDDVRSLLRRYDRELIVVEDPPIMARLPAAVMLREVLRESPELYRLERAFPIRSSSRSFDGKRLLVYRSLVRNPIRATKVDIEMLSLRRRLTTDVPWRK